MHHYQAFGLTIRSAIRLPELLPISELSDADLSIVTGTSGFDEKINSSSRYQMEVPSVGRFLIESGNQITIQMAEDAAQSAIRLFLLGSCFGCILQQRGYVVLHGNAISTDGITCKIVVGRRGAGKSTTAAWHYLRGAQILADDVCAVTIDDDGRASVVPSYPQIKLWQASADLLGIQTTGLRRIRPDADKFGLPLGAQFQGAPLPLTDVIEIDQAAKQDNALHGTKKLKPLIEHSYRYKFVQSMGLIPEYHRKLIRLAMRVRVSSAPRVVIA